MKNLVSKLTLLGFGLYFFIPLFMTLIYVFSEKWTNHILPSGLTTEWINFILNDSRFWLAFGHSMFLAIVTGGIILIIMVPSVSIIFFYFPKLDQFLQVFSLMPFAIPAVILATGLLRMYSGIKEIMLIVLIGALFVGAFPVMYQSIRNSLLSLQARVLIEAAETLGANHLKIFICILLPNMALNLKLSGLLVFSSIFGEFVLTNLLIGGQFETIRIYMLLKMRDNGHLASAVMLVYFITLIILALFLNHYGKMVDFLRGLFIKMKRQEQC
jgi:putative spermidine/putrescine transport system permease protein